MSLVGLEVQGRQGFKEEKIEILHIPHEAEEENK